MKTVTDIQTELRDISGRIDTLSTELSEIVRQESHGDTAWEIDFAQLQALGKRKPLYGHMLSKTDEMTKKHYFSLLISVLNLLPDNQEHGWLIIQRIACGVHLKAELSELVVDAATLSPKLLDEFTSSMTDGKLRSAFILDSMVIYLSCKGNDKNALQYIASIAEYLGCKNEDMPAFIDVAKCVASQNQQSFLALCCDKCSVDLSIALCYFMPTEVEVVSDIKSLQQSKSDNIMLFNMHIHGTTEELSFSKIHAKTIDIYACTFDSVRRIESLGKKIKFDTVIFSKNDSITAENCIMINCKFKDSFKCKDIFYPSLCRLEGVFIYLKNSIINNCEFHECHRLKHSPLAFCTYENDCIIAGSNSAIKACRFMNCSGDSIIVSSSSISSDICDNTFTNCDTNSEITTI